MTKVLQVLVGLFCFALVGCSVASNEMAAGNISDINHVEGTAINWFSVNGYRASGGGGEQCCIVLPIRWRPGLLLEIEWEVDPDANASLRRKATGYGFEEEDLAKHRANYQVHRTTVEVPPWPDTKSCSLKVHFLPCQQVKVTTSCWGYGSPNNPIKEPRNMKEPAACPK
ncbi:DUF3304 domain-containing protein [Pseudomonas solani]|uniref:DUF3304 domain-containing protein n=1 Tax=Pseudomonas solani TaxID=2731552 RepID=A0AAU7Y208_9PSED